MSEPASSKLIVALDFADWYAVESLVSQLDPRQCRVKVGHRLFTSLGPEVIHRLNALRFQVFLDLKFHDIPNTVASACLAAADMGVWMLNVHASGGPAMLEAARHALSGYGADKPLLIAVTVLTSMDSAALTAIGLSEQPVNRQVSRLAQLTADCGLDGVVASAQEATSLRQAHGCEFIIVTPGIRLAGDKQGVGDDQKRIVTPRAASQAGADYLVIGRPITQASSPQQVVTQLLRDLR